MKKGKLIGKIFAIALVFVMIGAVLSGFPTATNTREVMAGSLDRIPTSGPQGGSATADELATAMNIPTELVVSASLGTSDLAGTHVFEVVTYADVTSTGFVYPTGIAPTLGSGQGVSYNYIDEPDAWKYYDYAGWLANGDEGDYLENKYHIGQDIPAEEGDPVYAIADGWIMHVSTGGWGDGNVGLFVKHELNTGDEFLALYGHVKNYKAVGDLGAGWPNVKSPVSVKAGEPFAEIGDFGNLDHLHFGIHIGADAPGFYDPGPQADPEYPRNNIGWGRMGLNNWDKNWPDKTNYFVDPIKWMTTQVPDSPVSTSLISGFPTSGNSFAAISSGSAQNALLPNDSGSLSTELGGLNNNQGNDLVQLTLTLNVPTGAKYWAVDWRFLSEEYPEWVGTQYNDAFLIETPSSTFTISGWTITAPNNVAVDPGGELVTINTVGAVGMSTTHSAGTTYDGATETLTTVAPIPSGSTTVTVVFSVMDLGDSIYDTTVFLDNFRFVSVDTLPDTDTIVSFWKLFAQEYLENMEEYEAGFVLIDTLSVVLVIGLLAVGTPVSIPLFIVGFATTQIMQLGVELANLVNDPPDENFYELVELETIEEIPPYDDSPLAVAKAEFVSKLLQQDAIVTAIRITLERLQGAEDANEPAYMAMQATALRHFSELLIVNQQELREALTTFGAEFVIVIEPIHEEVKDELIRLATEGLSPEERELLQQAGITSDEFQMIEDILQSLQIDNIDDEFHHDVKAALDLWASWINEAVLPTIEQGITDVDALLATIEMPESNRAPVFDIPPTPSAGTESAIAAGDTIMVTVQASDTDPGDEVILAVVGAPVGATLMASQVGTISISTFSWTPTASQKGVHILTFIAVDKYGLPATPHQIVIVVQLMNHPPVAEAGPDQTIERTMPEGAEVTLNGSGSYDPDGDPLSYEWSWPSGTASGMSPTVVLPMGTTALNLSVSDGKASDTDTVNITVVDTTPPDVYIDVPHENAAVQDGVTLTATASDLSGVTNVYFYIREPDGSQGTPIGHEDLEANLMSGSPQAGQWQSGFDTTVFPDGHYVILAKAVDTYGNEVWSDVVSFSIRNWAILELLPASERNKGGRTMPVKFSLRVAASVDPGQPFVYNEELTIKIFAASNPSNILQMSTFGDTARDYRIDTLSELYITNLKTLRTPMQYTVEIWRTNKNFMVGSFTFETVK